MIYLTLFECPALGSDGSAIFSDRVWAVLGGALDLTSRQVQILREVFDDSTESMMAANLGVSIRTVRSHLARIYDKLGAQDRVSLALRVATEFVRLFGDPTRETTIAVPAPGTDRLARWRPSRPDTPGLLLRHRSIPLDDGEWQP
jgi:DNA-binding CsgD family transcriptional regulator